LEQQSDHGGGGAKSGKGVLKSAARAITLVGPMLYSCPKLDVSNQHIYSLQKYMLSGKAFFKKTAYHSFV